MVLPWSGNLPPSYCRIKLFVASTPMVPCVVHAVDYHCSVSRSARFGDPVLVPPGFVVDSPSALSEAHKQLCCDTELLFRQGFMDYSLLLSVTWLRSQSRSVDCCKACLAGTLTVRHPFTDASGIVKFGIIDMLQVRCCRGAR
jgi:hypothetical protein